MIYTECPEALSGTRKKVWNTELKISKEGPERYSKLVEVQNDYRHKKKLQPVLEIS